MLVAMLAFSTASSAAQSPFSTGEGKGSVLLRTGAFVQLETADKAIEASYQHELLGRVDRVRTTHPSARVRVVPRIGLTMRAALDDGRGSVFGDDRLAVGGGVTGNLGWTNLFSSRPSGNEVADHARIGVILADIAHGGKTRQSLRTLHDALEKAENELAAILSAQREWRANVTIPHSPADSFALAAIEKERTAALAATLEVYLDRRLLYASLYDSYFDSIAVRYPFDKAAYQRQFPAKAVQDVLEKRPSTGLPKRPMLHTPPVLVNEGPIVLAYILDGVPKGNTPEQKALDAAIARTARYPASNDGGPFWDQLDLRVGVSRHEYKILAPDAAFASQVRTESPTGASAVLSYSAEWGAVSGTTCWSRVFGVAVGGERRSNAGNLKSVDLRDVVFSSMSTPSTPGQPTTLRTAESVRKVLRGDYQEYTALVTSVDLVLYPPALENRVGVELFTRSSSSGGGVTAGFTPGVGVLLVQKGAPRKVNGGVSLSWPKGKKPAVDLILGFNF